MSRRNDWTFISGKEEDGNCFQQLSQEPYKDLMKKKSYPEVCVLKEEGNPSIFLRRHDRVRGFFFSVHIN